MIQELKIKNFAIIDELRISFERGFNVFTGETGAGKSIIINAIDLILGGRASNELIRTGEEEATVEALFEINNYYLLKDLLKNKGVQADDTLLINRIISRSGKNRIYINGGLSTLNILSEIGNLLVDIYGQHEHQTLLREESHIDILDEYGRLVEIRNEFNNIYKRVIETAHELQSYKESELKKKERYELLRFQSREIESANLKLSEDDELKKEREILLNAEKLFQILHKGDEDIYSSEQSIIDKLSELSISLKGIIHIDEKLSQIYERLESSIVQLKDIASSMKDYIDGVNYDPQRLEYIENRLDEINKLKRKYGQTIDEILKFKETICDELEHLDSLDEKISSLEKEFDEQKKRALKVGRELSAKRLKVANELAKRVEKELSELGMKNTIFKVSIESELEKAEKDIENSGHNGFDKIAFLISPNIGEIPKSLARIASGGEMSRIMLALKRILVSVKSVPILIFDEVDVGIGGSIADIIGKKLKAVSNNHQVFCITHLPQIASYADSHFSVLKEVENKRTTITVKKLDEEERIEEIARMMAGVEVTKKVRDHAREMIYRAL